MRFLLLRWDARIFEIAAAASPARSHRRRAHWQVIERSREASPRYLRLSCRRSQASGGDRRRVPWASSRRAMSSRATPSWAARLEAKRELQRWRLRAVALSLPKMRLNGSSSGAVECQADWMVCWKPSRPGQNL